MGLNVGRLLNELRRLTVPELRERYAEVHGEETTSRHKDYLIRRIAWRMQANEEGDFEQRARRIRALAKEIANDADLRTRAPAPGRSQHLAVASPAPTDTCRTKSIPLDVPNDTRLPMPGAVLTRQYKGRAITVRVLPDGFDYQGEVYRSLSAVAKAATGAHWNGYLFFGLTAPKQSPPSRTKRP